MKVLIVDDDKLARKGLIAIMNWEKYGFEVAGDVQNGRKALEFIKENPVDIVFTDIDMPEIDGIELMQMCREDFPNVKFVIFSVYEDFGYAQTAIRLGALDYISKISFDPEECEQILEQISRKYRRICRQAPGAEADMEKVKELEDEDIVKLVREIIEDKLNLKSNYIFKSAPKFIVLTNRLVKVVSQSIEYIVDGLRNTDFEVVGNELEFKNDKNNGVLKKKNLRENIFSQKVKAIQFFE